MSRLTDIEKEISNCVNLDKSNWTQIYRLIEEVEREKLYVERPDTRSFTGWVNALAADLHVHVSLLWSRKKAGKVYEEYRQRAEEHGRVVPELEDISVSPDSLSLCEKVAGKNATEMDRLIDRVIDGELTREDLRQAARVRRGSSSVAATPTRTRHNRIDAADRTESDDRVTAYDVTLALRHSGSGWLQTKREDPHFQHVYQTFPEFRVDTGSSHYSRRIDVLVAETITETERDHITLRGIEIKVDMQDLVNDHKMAEYTDFVDYFYICIPEGDVEMLAVAKEISLEIWGIMTVSKKGEINIEREPQRLNPVFRDKTLSTALIKSITA